MDVIACCAILFPIGAAARAHCITKRVASPAGPQLGWGSRAGSRRGAAFGRPHLGFGLRWSGGVQPGAGPEEPPGPRRAPGSPHCKTWHPPPPHFPHPTPPSPLPWGRPLLPPALKPNTSPLDPPFRPSPTPPRYPPSIPRAVWQIKHLKEAAEVDGKAARSLAKLKLFRSFYVTGGPRRRALRFAGCPAAWLTPGWCLGVGVGG
jgi:hypothetical protein